MTRKPLTPLGAGEYGFALFGQVTYIDHSGHQMLHPFSAEHVSNFSDGLAAVTTGKNIWRMLVRKSVYLNKGVSGVLSPSLMRAS